MELINKYGNYSRLISPALEETKFSRVWDSLVPRCDYYSRATINRVNTVGLTSDKYAIASFKMMSGSPILPLGCQQVKENKKKLPGNYAKMEILY